MRVLYLRSSLSANGRSSLSGRVLLDAFKAAADDVLLGFWVCERNERVADPVLAEDAISYDLAERLDPTVIYVEGGLFATDDGRWKIPRELAERLVRRGAVLVAADVDCNEVTLRSSEHYAEALRFFKASIDWGGRSHGPVYGSDSTSCWRGHRQPICLTERMVMSEWLRPVYASVPSVLVGNPWQLASWENLLASGNGDTSGTLQADVWVDRIHPFPWASVANVGKGYAVLMAGDVSSDVWTQQNPANTTWLLNICQFLEREAARDVARAASHHRSDHQVFLSHRWADKPIVEQVAATLRRTGIGTWYDREQIELGQSIVEGIDQGLGTMTHFALFWSRHCVDAPWVARELNAAVAKLTEQSIPILVIRLDDTPVLPIVTDLHRLEAREMLPGEIAEAIGRSVLRRRS